MPAFHHIKLSSCSSMFSMQEVGIDISMESSRRVLQRPRKLIEVPGQVHLPISKITVSVRRSRILWFLVTENQHVVNM